jgi:hypothetical protein
MRVYVPYGDEWYGYLVRRMAEKPANLVPVPALPDLEGLTAWDSSRCWAPA